MRAPREGDVRLGGDEGDPAAPDAEGAGRATRGPPGAEAGRGGIRTDCYLAVLDRYRRKHPRARFEVITRAAGHPLSPSWGLVRRGREGLPLPKYREALLGEFRARRAEVEAELRRLRALAESGRTVFLVCYERDPARCHRSAVARLVRDPPLLDEGADWPADPAGGPLDRFLAGGEG